MSRYLHVATAIAQHVRSRDIKSVSDLYGQRMYIDEIAKWLQASPGRCDTQANVAVFSVMRAEKQLLWPKQSVPSGLREDGR